MTDPQTRPQRVTTRADEHEVVVYDFHIEIDVKAPVIDEKRLQKIIDDRIQRLTASLSNTKAPQ
jgi:uncharacterized OsmC-like protein